MCKNDKADQGIPQYASGSPVHHIFFLMATLVAYRSSWARDWIWAAATTYPTAAVATRDSLTHWAKPGIEPSPLQWPKPLQLDSLPTVPQWERLHILKMPVLFRILPPWLHLWISRISQGPFGRIIFCSVWRQGVLWHGCFRVPSPRVSVPPTFSAPLDF